LVLVAPIARVGAALHLLAQPPGFYRIPAALAFATDLKRDWRWEKNMSISTILLILLVLLLIGALPTWPYSGGWGYYPAGGLGLVVIILLVLVVAGRI
jgi:hypothetical protein